MLPDKDGFYKNFPKYTDGLLQCVNGVVTDKVLPEARLISYSSPAVFFKLFSRLEVGMKIDECWKIWSNLAMSTTLSNWVYWKNWTPVPGTWWVHPETGVAMTIRDGKVAPVLGANPRQKINPSRGYKRQFKDIVMGMTLEQVREITAEHAPYCRNVPVIFYFTPRGYRAKTADKITKAEQERQERQEKKKLPPLLSTDRYDVRIFYPGDREGGKPESVQVCLFALTKIWEDDKRTAISPLVKSHVKEYFTYARRCILASDYFKKNPQYVELLKSDKMRVTKDCCIEIDFNVA